MDPCLDESSKEVLKNTTKCDTLLQQGLHNRDVIIKLPFVPFLLCSEFPPTNHLDSAIAKRLIVVPFISSLVNQIGDEDTKALAEAVKTNKLK